MEIVSEGTLESISRPASSTSDVGRSIGGSRTAKSSGLHTFSLLELLPPEESNLTGIPGELISALEQDVEVVDFEEEEVDKESEDESEVSLSVEDTGEEEDADHPDEHQALVKTSQVSEDHDSYSSSPHGNQETGDEPLELTEGENIDPKIREGLEKIKKLDKILSDKLKKEKDVKNQRHLLEKVWKEQLQQIIKSPDGSTNNPLVGATLLALELGNEDVLGSSRDDPITPVFATQPLNTDELSSARYQDSSSVSESGTECSSQAGSARHSKRSRRHSKGSGKRQPSSRQESEKGTSNRKGNKDQGKSKGQDFIKRNKQLAADAANAIPMTEEEKARLEKLLVDDDTDTLMTENPYETSNLSITSGRGFQPDQESARALADIEEKLQALVPANELELLSSRSITYTPLSEKSDAAISEHSKASELLCNLENIDIGEKVLREERDVREMHQRLLSIENELERLKKLSEDEHEEKVSQELLHKLLGESSRTTSRSTTVGQTVLSSLSNPHYYSAIEEGPGKEELTPRPLSSISDVTASDILGEGSLGGTLSALRTISTLSDVTLTGDEETPRTLTSVSSLQT